MNLRFWNIFIFHGSFAANAEMNQKNNNLVLRILNLKTKTVQNVLIFVWYKGSEFFKYPEIFEPLYYKKTRIGGREVWVFKKISSFNYLCNESIRHWSHFIYRPIFKIVSAGNRNFLFTFSCISTWSQFNFKPDLKTRQF